MIGKVINGAIYAIVGVIVLFYLYAELVPEAQTAGDDLNASGVPLGNLFVSGGFVFILVMVGLLLVIVRLAMPKAK